MISAPSAQATPVAFVDRLARLFPSYPGAEVIYASSEQALYRSQDGGENWDLAGPPPPSSYLAVGAGGAGLLLSGDHIPCGAAGGEDPPLSRSVDGGLTWQPITGVAGIRPMAIWIEGQLALGVDCGGLLRSTDSGLTWEALPLPDNSYGPTAVAPITISNDPSAALVLVIGTSEGGTSRLWQANLTQTAGQVFEELNLDPFWGYGALDARDDLYVVGTAQGVLVSSDAGESFPEQPSRTGLGGIISVDPLQTSIPESERGFGVSAVAINETNPDHLYAGTADGVYASLDRGKTWQKMQGADGQVSKLVVQRGGTYLFAETNKGVIALPLSP
jgi:photosystem II stability/assembly factor-like uncharacterized protein